MAERIVQTSIGLTLEQLEDLEEKADEEEVSKSEIARRWLKTGREVDDGE